MRLTKRQAHALIWLLALLPALIALLFVRPFDWQSTGAVLNLLGRLTGIAGLGCMLAAAILSCRVPGLDKPFGGLTKLWRTHHLVAAAAFLLLLAHPLLLALSAAEVSLAAARQTLLGSTQQWALWVGWAALLLTMVFLVPSFKFFGEPDYQRWKHLHRLAAPAVVLGLVHTLWLMRTLPMTWAWTLWSLLALLAIVSIGYRFLYSRWRGRHRYRIRAVVPQANNVVELSLNPEGAPLRHAAGQFVYLTPDDPELANGRGEEHPYTISSAPEEPELRIAIKALGDASRALQHVRPGTGAELEGPYGDFFPPEPDNAPELWIAGGIGITPFLARARQLALRQKDADVVLIFCVQDAARALFLEELTELAGQIPGLRLELHFFAAHGPLDAAFVCSRCPDVDIRTLRTCGPDPLLDLVRHIGRSLGVPRGRMVSEEFNLL